MTDFTDSQTFARKTDKPGIFDKPERGADPTAGDTEEAKRLQAKVEKERFELYERPIADAVRLSPVRIIKSELSEPSWVADAREILTETERRLKLAKG